MRWVYPIKVTIDGKTRSEKVECSKFNTLIGSVPPQCFWVEIEMDKDDEVSDED